MGTAELQKLLAAAHAKMVEVGRRLESAGKPDLALGSFAEARFL